ncbi:hypothetical protein B0H15DRAFT_949613 [Mycena belliarum]|uniref:Uncharacterized protein n=1 Tax=Mycena belliarum TaxID=1033014 RepID=A0AAD6U7T2_9AGAR|nr:hypothetical protein B0H15DRAFT_949613 [Mycena belliae]
MAPTTQPAAPPFGAGQSWESQLVCLFMIFGFALFYNLCCHLYAIGAFRKRPAVDQVALDGCLRTAPSQKPRVPGT